MPWPWASFDARATMMFTCAQPLPENAVAPAEMGAKAISASPEAAARVDRTATRWYSVPSGRRGSCARFCLGPSEASGAAVPAREAKNRLSIPNPQIRADGIGRGLVERDGLLPANSAVPPERAATVDV